MKKSIKKACSIALLLTSTTAMAGVNALVLSSNKNTNNNVVYAEQLPSALTMLNVASHNSEALLGDDYTIPTATLVVNGSSTTLTSDNYTIVSPIGENVTENVEQGKLTLNRIGTYVINYSIVNSGKTYTASVEVNVKVGSNTINLLEDLENKHRILPEYVFQSYNKDIYIPKAEVEFANDTVEQDYTITTIITSPTQKTLTFDEVTGKLNYTSLEEGTYSVKYIAKTTDGVYLNSRTEEFVVLSDNEFKNEYGSTDYTLEFGYSKTVPTSADIGEELDLPLPTGKIGTKSTPVYYKIEAFVYADGKTVDVSNQTINGNKFTAQKSYTVDGQTYNIDNGRYLFYYNVTDALGKKAERTGFEISGVKDTKAPEIKVEEHKIQSLYTNGKNIVIKAFTAEDLADDTLELTRYIRSSVQSSTEDDLYTDKGKAADIYTKDIVFNKTNDFAFDENTMVDGGELEINANATYTVYYEAKDSANKVGKKSYTFKVDAREYTSAPTVEFKDTFPKSANNGDKIIFSAPVASDTIDERPYTQVMYKFDNEANWTTIDADKNGKYTVAIDKEGATSLKIRAKTENDAPLTALETNADNDIKNYSGFKYGYDEVEITIKDQKDETPPTVVSLSDFAGTYNQNDEVVLPTLTLTDDLVDYVDVNINVTHNQIVDSETVTQSFDVEDAFIMRAGNTLVLKGAKFYATLAGNYDIVYEITDAGNNKSYIYQYATVTQKQQVSEPKFSNLPEALSGGKLELGESLTLPVPELPGADGEYDYYVNVKGPVGSQLNKETFTAKKAGTYTIIYDLYKTTDVDNIVDTKEFKVVVSDNTNPEVRVEWDLNDSYAQYSKVLIPVFSASDISNIDMESSKIAITSSKNSFNLEIKGSDVASLLEQYYGWLDEEEKIKNGDIDEHVNYEKPGKLLLPLDYNEQYTVTYTIYDNSVNKNSVSKSYTIKVGDLVAPSIDLDDDIIASNVKIDTKLSIDLSKISILDNKTQGMTALKDIKIVVKNTTTGKTLNKIDEDEDKYEYNIDTAGEYSVTFSATDAAGNTKTVTRTFTVNEPSNDGATTNEVITIVLCCVAVVVLAGSIVYMVISKKKSQQYK